MTILGKLTARKDATITASPPLLEQVLTFADVHPLATAKEDVFYTAPEHCVLTRMVEDMFIYWLKE